MEILTDQLAVPKKQKSMISYFFEDPRKFTHSPAGELLIFGIGKMQINLKI